MRGMGVSAAAVMATKGAAVRRAGRAARVAIWVVERSAAVIDLLLQPGDAAVAHGRQIIALIGSTHVGGLHGAVADRGAGRSGAEQGSHTERECGGFEI